MNHDWNKILKDVLYTYDKEEIKMSMSDIEELVQYIDELKINEETLKEKIVKLSNDNNLLRTRVLIASLDDNIGTIKSFKTYA